MADQPTGEGSLLAITGELGTESPSASTAVVAKGTRVRGGDSVQWVRARAAESLALRQSQQEALVLQQELPLGRDERLLDACEELLAS